MARMPWMKLWTEDLDRDCSGLSCHAFGAWMRIILDLRKHSGSRSLTLNQWARVVRSSQDETAAALLELVEEQICNASVTSTSRVTLRDICVDANSDARSDARVTLTCRRIEREAKASTSHKLRQKRYRHKTKSDAKVTLPVTPKLRSRDATDAEAEADVDTEAEESVCISSSGRRVALAPKNGGQKHTHTHGPPANFILTDELRKWTEAAAHDLDPEAEVEKFLDYYRRKGEIFADWPAAWRTWIRTAVSRQARAPTRRESVEEHNRRVFREVEALEAKENQRS